VLRPRTPVSAISMALAKIATTSKPRMKYVRPETRFARTVAPQLGHALSDALKVALQALHFELDRFSLIAVIRLLKRLPNELPHRRRIAALLVELVIPLPGTWKAQMKRQVLFRQRQHSPSSMGQIFSMNEQRLNGNA